jgi:hypothetical protein
MQEAARTIPGFHSLAAACPRQWLYLFGEEGVVYSEAGNRFAGLDAAGVAAYQAFDAGVGVEDLRKLSGGHSIASAPGDSLETIHALSRGIFPADEAPAEWPAFDSSDSLAANIEIAGIPILLEYPAGPLEDLCRDYFRNCPASVRPTRCHISALQNENGGAIYVNGSEFLSLSHADQLGLGLMHAARSLLYAEGGYDVAFHAAMIARDECGLMLCAPRESGKSTLAAYLVAQGFDLLTDEPALLHLDTCTVSPLRTPISLKQGSWPLLRQHWPQLASAPVHRRSDGVKICLAHPPAERYSTQPRRLTHILFTQYSPSSVPQLEPLSPLRTLHLLNEGGSLLAKHLARDKFEEFLKFVCLTPAYKMRYASLDEARGMLHELDCIAG